jgi:hypothetical protein
VPDDGAGRRLLEGEAHGLPHEPVLAGSRIPGEGAVLGDAEDLVTRLELRRA